MANLVLHHQLSIPFPLLRLTTSLSSRRRWNCSLVVVRRPPELSPSSLSASTASKERPRIGLRRLHSPPSSSLLDWLARRRSPFPQPSPSSASTTSIDAPSPPILFRPRHRSKRALAVLTTPDSLRSRRRRHPRRAGRSLPVRRSPSSAFVVAMHDQQRNAVAGSCSRVSHSPSSSSSLKALTSFPTPSTLLRRPEALASSRIVDSMQSASLIRRDDDGWGVLAAMSEPATRRAVDLITCTDAMGLRGWMTRDDLCIVGMVNTIR
ncbi:hypothetical protein DFP72DRAFT_1074502 [Ephemerocybe angulata]|uniref:Uncharacterized protein n=1 Tax=Ephemerocybe angulata TaxID=980116 RepID=A0A8H6LZ32_9AGAR|nr:hypothetical protein DFP72DRAFT_1074502 [Tulosesus angulatus]